MKRFAAAIRVTLACWFLSSLSVVCRADGERLFPNAPSVAAERPLTLGMNFPLQTSDPAAQNAARPQMASQTAKPELAGWSKHGFWTAKTSPCLRLSGVRALSIIHPR